MVPETRPQRQSPPLPQSTQLRSTLDPEPAVIAEVVTLFYVLHPFNFRLQTSVGLHAFGESPEPQTLDRAPWGHFAGIAGHREPVTGQKGFGAHYGINTRRRSLKKPDLQSRFPY